MRFVADSMIILRYGNGAIGLTGWGWFILVVLAIISGRS